MGRLARHASPTLFTATLAVLAVLPAAHAERRPHAGMLRYPDVSSKEIVFLYAGRLWLVPREGGVARVLADPPGAGGFPRFSPDEKTIAFVANYDGNDDLYTLPVEGGMPFRVTYHPASELLCDWTPDGKLLYSSRGHYDLERQMHLFVTAATGGMPEKLPVPYGAVAAISPDGQWLAYTPHTTDNRTWKRYLGGMATDIWLFNLRDHTSKKITEWEGTDSQPMWHGQTIYYMSDGGPEHRLNIWMYDTKSGKREQITHEDKFDIKWPSIGPGPKGGGEVVYQCGPDLHLLDLATRKSRVVEVTVPGDRPDIRPQRVAVEKFIDGWDISSTGKRGVFEARGDIWTVPAKKGSPRNLTRTSGVAERSPSWSPNGRWIAYFSDQTGEYELYVRQSDGKEAPRQLTSTSTKSLPREGMQQVEQKLPQVFRYNPVWSPDSKHIAFTDKTGALYVHTLEALEPQTSATSQPSTAGASSEPTTQEAGLTPGTRLVDRDAWAMQPQASWSHDAKWLAYTLSGDNMLTAICLYHLPTGDRRQVTGGFFRDTWPAFDRAGNYLFFASNRHFADPIYEDIGSTFAYTNSDRLIVVPLRADLPLPWAPKTDEETWKDKARTAPDRAGEDTEKGQKEDQTDQADPADAGDKPSGSAASQKSEDVEEEKPEKKKDEAKKPLRIDRDGFEQRARALPVKPGSFSHLAVSDDGKLLYVRHGRPGTDEKPKIQIFDLAAEQEDKEGKDKDEDRSSKGEKTVLEGVGEFAISADGKKLIAHKDDTYAIVSAAAGQNFDEPMPTGDMAALVDPREEWRQVFTDAWRIQRDFFYDPNMHGVNWPALRDQYAAMLDDCVSRADVSFVIRELISELNVGHAYYWGDSADDVPHVSVGLLGVDFELADGAYRIKRVYTGGAWDVDARNPLAQLGMPAKPSKDKTKDDEKKDEDEAATSQPTVKAGDYVLAVNGTALDVSKDPWAGFQGLASKVVTLTVSEKPALDDAAREVVIKLISPEEEAALRYRAWVEENRALVERQSNGQVGYIHVPDTGTDGQNELFRQFYGQRSKAALIIDERWNGGGQIPHRFIELLNRPVTNYWACRDSRSWPSPGDAHQGPKCMLINGLAGSGGDAFPYYFRQAKLGKLIGTRTWGGLVGISGNPGLIDGAYVSVPTFAFYKTTGHWGIEGYGVAPDIEVIDDPALMVDGGDPQLDAAVKLMLDEVRAHPYMPTPKPPSPNRSGIGVREEDR